MRFPGHLTFFHDMSLANEGIKKISILLMSDYSDIRLSFDINISKAPICGYHLNIFAARLDGGISQN